MSEQCNQLDLIKLLIIFTSSLHYITELGYHNLKSQDIISGEVFRSTTHQLIIIVIKSNEESSSLIILDYITSAEAVCLNGTA